MNQSKESKHVVDVLFVIALFCVFAICALMLVIIGADVYKKTVRDMDENYDSRTAFAYVTEKIRQNDVANALSIKPFGESDAICITEYYNDTAYITYLYLHDGFLCELNMRGDSKLDPSSGDSILPVQSFFIEQVNPQLYLVKLATSTDTTTLYISTRSGN
ncbi:MAG: DUF4860 domain-containing protein [Lachnospiraceae bacterium]